MLSEAGSSSVRDAAKRPVEAIEREPRTRPQPPPAPVAEREPESPVGEEATPAQGDERDAATVTVETAPDELQEEPPQIESMDEPIMPAVDEETSDDDRAMLSAWIKRQHTIESRMSNRGAAHRSVAVRERLPVSEIDRVKIAFDARHSTPGHGPDADGFIDWRVELEHFGQGTVELRYALDKHQDVAGI